MRALLFLLDFSFPVSEAYNGVGRNMVDQNHGKVAKQNGSVATDILWYYFDSGAID